MTRVAYLAHGVAGSATGVHQKILAQARAWAEIDRTIEVAVFVRCEAGAEDDWVGRPHVVAVTSSRWGPVGRLVARERLSLSVERWRPDVIYLRQSTVSPSVVALALRHPTVIELNTLDLSELRARSRLRYLYAVATRDLLLRRAAGLIAVSGQIAADRSVRRLGRRVVVVPNAVDVSRIVPTAPPKNATPHLVFVGTPGHPWHGVDKVVRLARLFPAWRFELVGPADADVPDRPPNIRVHGLLDPDATAAVLGEADVAIGSLALHRIGLEEASPLKVGEYVAHGLPTIVGYTDTRFPDGAPFLLRIPNSERNVEDAAAAIEAFVSSWNGRRVSVAEAGGISTLVHERTRLRFMISAVAANARRGGERVRILGIPVDALTMQEAVTKVLAWKAGTATETAHFCNAHLLVTARDDPGLRKALEGASLNATDGMPLVWLARRYVPRAERVSGPDLMLAVLERGRSTGSTHYLYGGAPGVAEALASKMRARFPGVEIVGTWSPPFREATPAELDADLERISATDADYVWVGLGAPKQERWIEGVRGRLTARGLLAVGAAFDFHSGSVRRAPAWMQARGLEWLFRLLMEPRRLWRRYAVTNTRFIVLAAVDLIRGRGSR